MKSRRLLLVLALGLGLALAVLMALKPLSGRARPAAQDLFVKAGSAGTCAQNDPCALQTALGLVANGDTIYVAGGAYTGTGSAVITVTKSITLYGGWNGLTGTLVISPTAYPATLDGEWARRVVYINGNITPTLDGFTITRGNATGLLAGCPSNPDGCGGGIFVRNAHPLILNNTIANNVAAITTTGNPTVAIGHGGGLYLNGATQAVVRYNLIISNAGSTAYRGSGGGMYLSISSDGVQVQFNQVLSNAATTTDAIGDGGGIWGGPSGVLIQGNVVAGNQTNSAGLGRGAGLFQYGGSAHYLYLGNLVQGNYGSAAVGLHSSRARFEDNRVVDNATSEGICLESGSGGGPTLVNNIVARNGSRALSAFGSASSILTATLLHNTLVGAGSGYGVYAQYAALYLTNTLVASTTWGITTTTLASSTILADHTLFWAVTYPGIQGTNPLSGDPAFVNPASGDYHLGAGSAAIDAGVPTTVTTDIDGDLRPIGLLPDIGADERWMYAYLPLVLRGYP
jgi:hypothetical protein